MRYPGGPWIGRLMGSVSPLQAKTRQYIFGMPRPGIISSPIRVIAEAHLASHGLLMGNTLPHVARMQRYKSGMQRMGRAFSSTEDIPRTSGPWRGHTMADVSLLEVRIRRRRYGI